MNTLTSPTKHRARFHSLTVTNVERLTDNAIAVSFGLDDDMFEEYAFEPGQHLTLRAEINGQDVRRSYSICRSRADALARRELRVAAARVAGGIMSNWLNDTIKVGDTIEVMTPTGSFTCPTDAQATRHHVAIAGGSGITPVLSLLKSALEEEPNSSATLIFGNRHTASIMFLEELEDLKNAYPARFQLINVLDQEATDVELFSGMLNKERLTAIVDGLIPVPTVDEWYLCGPFPMVEGAQQLLEERGVPTAKIHHELFRVDGQDDPEPVIEIDTSAPPEAIVTVNLDGRTTVVEMPSKAESILAATLRARPDAPYACKGGVCGTCRARLVEGEVTMTRNYALEPEEIAAGIVLACQAHPVTEKVVLDYDA
ncbi:MAG: phenylacetate-CoA oxygenase/reductase subunit PaaK [Austwickia sp.]|jgi:ring-1,2-phenylacetyl-CoA epoxidase subunit PaaE|nr:phenylacetate-CoA oxygenase/reductase subunit PaaK [Austwickia sp.]MBK8435018.1 phenylacetate-CoA oxygenase/reductase subunit PaaK [Austwickia sp.]MBK9101426.1 phenylacetate-CoA oxygenase/reductase subunit PaaK [Austwickia sp.]